MCVLVKDIKAGGFIVIQRKRDKRKILVKVAKVINEGKGEEEILLSKAHNDYFIWSMYMTGDSWVERVWAIDLSLELTSLTNNINEFPR
jgi:hypothetical protein